MTNIRSFPAAFVLCRATQHKWDLISTPGNRRAEFGTYLTHQCLSCGTKRFLTISDVTGDILQRRYEYPEGFQYRTDGENDFPFTKSEWRKEYLRRKRAGVYGRNR